MLLVLLGAISFELALGRAVAVIASRARIAKEVVFIFSTSVQVVIECF